MNKDLTRAESLLERIAAALEHRYGRASDGAFTLKGTDAFVWEADTGHLVPVKDVAALPLSLLKGIDQARDVLHQNTQRFADGLPANNALLWGARGMGKSSLVKAAHATVAAGQPAGAPPLKLVEINREDIESLPDLMRLLRDRKERFILFCDDLSFDAGDASYKSLKAAL